jgi:hypothetical protein
MRTEGHEEANSRFSQILRMRLKINTYFVLGTSCTTFQLEVRKNLYEIYVVLMFMY